MVNTGMFTHIVVHTSHSFCKSQKNNINFNLFPGDFLLPQTAG